MREPSPHSVAAFTALCGRPDLAEDIMAEHYEQEAAASAGAPWSPYPEPPPGRHVPLVRTP